MTATPDKKAADFSTVGSAHAAAMFGAALIFLAVLAIVVQWWNSSKILEHDSRFTAQLMTAVWVPFILEALLGLVLNPATRGNVGRFFMLSALPPFRLGYSTFAQGDSIWLPGLGWQTKGRQLFEELDRRATIPMLVIALMILPLLGVEFLLKEKVAELPWLSITLDVCAAFIWFAFALEFVIMVSVAEDKVAYCKKNWLNLLIILLPLIAFLRGFQVVRAFRVARAGKLLRVYRMRSLLLRIYQALVAISAIERLIYRNPDKHLAQLEKAHLEKERELAALREKIESVRQRVAEFRESKAERETGEL